MIPKKQTVVLHLESCLADDVLERTCKREVIVFPVEMRSPCEWNEDEKHIENWTEALERANDEKKFKTH